ncbi:MAG: hypothetical protein OWQ48_01815 [Desulfurococcus sp.]|nr:hypothetical protein [Desulfurococcus sp.]
MSIEVKLSYNTILALAVALLSLVVFAYVYWFDSGLSYTWIIPLNTAQSIHVYFKESVTLGLVDVRDGSISIEVIRGVPWELILGPAETKYAVVSVRGLSLYTTVVNAAGIPAASVTAWVISKKARGVRLIIAVAVILLLVALNAASSILYLSTGLNAGYTASDRRVSLPLSEMRVYLNETTPSLYYYATTDSINGVALVNISFNFKDNIIPSYVITQFSGQGVNESRVLTVYLPVEAGGVLRSNGGIVGEAYYTRYTVNSNISIYVVSTGELQNSTLTYYKVSFQRIGSWPPLIIVLLPLISLVVMLASCTLLARRL